MSRNIAFLWRWWHGMCCFFSSAGGSLVFSPSSCYRSLDSTSRLLNPSQLNMMVTCFFAVEKCSFGICSVFVRCDRCYSCVWQPLLLRPRWGHLGLNGVDGSHQLGAPHGLDGPLAEATGAGRGRTNKPNKGCRKMSPQKGLEVFILSWDEHVFLGGWYVMP